MHPNARLTVHARRELVRRVEAGWPAGEVATQLGVSRATVYKWWRRWRDEGDDGLQDRSSRPHRSPTRTSASAEAAIVDLRRRRRLGPARIGPQLGIAPSTVYAVLRRNGLHRLAWIDRPTGRVVRRYEKDRPGELLHVDTKKLGRVPDGGGWRLLGRNDQTVAARHRRPRIGSEHVHAAVDDHSRLAYVEVLDTAKATDTTAFMIRAIRWFADQGVQIEAVMTDNAWAYVNSQTFRSALADADIRHVRIPPRSPQINGKVERFNRTMVEEWAYAELFTSNQQRRDALDGWLHNYNHHRAHTSLAGRPPASRVDNLTGHYT